MTLVVEDGTVVAGAESYLSVADADAYWLKFDNPATWSGLSNDAKEGHLRAATRWLDANYRWRGFVQSDTQVLGWPRTGVRDREGRAVAEDSVPPKLKDATAEMAHHFAQGAVVDVVESGKQVVRQRVGPVEVQYAAQQSTSLSLSGQGLNFHADPGRNTKVFATVDGLLVGLSRRPLQGVVPVVRRG